MNMKKISNTKTNISIVICAYNGWIHTNQLLGDIKNKCLGVGEVIVVNNGSDDIDMVKGLSFWKRMGVIPISTITLEENLGFSGGFNTGLRSASGDIVIAISNDVRIYTPNFLQNVEEAIEGGTCIAGGRLLSQNTGWNQFEKVIVPYLEGWLIAAKKDTWKELEYFDTRYDPSDFEDVDFSMKAVKAGYDLVELPVGGVEHLGARTIGYNPERAERTIKNQKKFKEKWNL